MTSLRLCYEFQGRFEVNMYEFTFFFKRIRPKGSVNYLAFSHHPLFFPEVQKGNLKRAIELYDKAIPLANTELEMAHIFGLKEAALAQITVSQKLGIEMPQMMGM